MHVSILNREFEVSFVLTQSKRAGAYVKDNKIRIRVPVWLPEKEKQKLVTEMMQMVKKRLMRNPNAFRSIKEPHFHDGQERSGMS